MPRDRGSEAAALNGAAVLAILRRRKLPLLTSIVLCPFLTFIALSQLSPRYTASGTLLYDNAEYKVRELQSILRVDPITDAIMVSQAEVLRGIPVIEQVTNRLNLYANPEFNPELRPRPWWRRIFHWLVSAEHAPAPDIIGPQLDPSRNATLAAVQDSLVVTPVKASHVLQVSFTAQDPLLAAAAVNHAMDAYVKAQLGAKYGAVMKARDWLEQRARELRAEVRQSEDQIARYRADHGLVEGMHASLDSEQISLLSENLARARSALAEAEGRLDAASGRAGAAAQAAIAPSVAPLRTRQDQFTAELQSMLGRLGPNHPEVRSTRTQLAETDRSISAEVTRVVTATEADVRADRDRVAKLQADLDDARARFQRDAQAQIPLNAMQRDAEASRSLLQTVLESIQQTAKQSAIEAPDAHEISLALPPGHPSFPRTGAWMAGAVAFGVLFGLLLAYLWELADATFRSGDDIRNVLRLPCLALIPTVRRRWLKDVVIEEYAARKPLSAFAEQLRALRAGLSLWPDQPHVVAITAARPREGKTVITHALGRLTAANGERVIVVDCDIRQPKPASEIGLVDYLLKRASLDQVIHKDHDTGMAFMPCGAQDTNALGLLMSGGMVRLLETLREGYDLVLLDTPPAEAITDARIVAGLADATLFCVRWRATSRHIALHALELLEEAHANVVGAALTQVDVNVHLRSGYADAEVYHPRYGGYFRE
ncbi:MAG TPA: polysaccharide biosynthesis tyrosine autokinase [Acetobacteraceae bacterium]|jgi:succinoglycan biosynthesis transport protein ExoP|nr:polysaccharide biosynthesis tyrosine autokinase [Acetobacteraceae bacterium]